MKFYSNGKILITGEYFVLNGALSLAVPTVYGQYLEINDNDSNIINWTSYNKNKEIWFKCDRSVNCKSRCNAWCRTII